MMSSMSRPANPYDNASCESFVKTLKREEIYANDYRTLDHLAMNIEQFIEQYYNRCRLHSALGYRPPEEFERASESGQVSGQLEGATIRFFNHHEDARSSGTSHATGTFRATDAGVDPAVPVDAKNASTRDLENCTRRSFPQRPHRSSFL